MNATISIVNSTYEDIDAIFDLYDAATIYQKKVFRKHWKGFERKRVETEIDERRQWKLIVDGQMVCVFVITFSDPFIWQERDKDPAIYLHRIATHPNYRGNGYVKEIVNWAKKFGKENGKNFVRLDTSSGNDKLNSYYIQCGFQYLGIQECLATDELPAHYKDGPFSLFEIALN